MILLTGAEAWDVLRVLERVVDAAEKAGRGDRDARAFGRWRPSCCRTCSLISDVR
jgi:hypothetical protein